MKEVRIKEERKEERKEIRKEGRKEGRQEGRKEEERKEERKGNPPLEKLLQKPSGHQTAFPAQQTDEYERARVKKYNICCV